MSVQEVIKKYENSRKESDKQKQILRQELDRSMEELTINSLKLQNHKVNQIHKNQQAIEARLRKQQELMQDFRKNQALWVGMYEELSRSLREAGDLVHYAGYIEAEIGELIGEDSVEDFLKKAQEEESTLSKPDEDGAKKIQAEVEKLEDKPGAQIQEDRQELTSKEEQGSSEVKQAVA